MRGTTEKAADILMRRIDGARRILARAGVERGKLETMIEAALRERDAARREVDRLLSKARQERDEARAMLERIRTEPVVQELEQARADAARLRGALEGLMLSRDASWTGGHDWEEALEAAAAALAWEGEVCAWTYDETHCAWDSACGEKWILMDGGPAENRIRYCHGCGRQVQADSADTPERAREP